jgi:hypothetical protein
LISHIQRNSSSVDIPTPNMVNASRKSNTAAAYPSTKLVAKPSRSRSGARGACGGGGAAAAARATVTTPPPGLASRPANAAALMASR